MGKSRWGILGTANIAREQFIPALQESQFGEAAAVASRDEGKARRYAAETGIGKWYGSYEELLADDDIEFIYNPLPNHLHVEWTKQAILAGKHVLCEKPLALNVRDVEDLLELREKSGLLIGEAFAVFHQSRLIALRQLFETKRYGTLESAHGSFYLHNTDPDNVRNAYREGGGALWDIGVYPVTVGRWMFGEEPAEVACAMDFDRRFGVDHHATGILRFPSGRQLSFGCGMRFPWDARMSFYTNTHRIEINTAYHADTKNQMIFEVFDGNRPPAARTYSFAPENQYRNEADHFVQAAKEGLPFAGSLEHALAGTGVITALFKSAASGKFERV